MHNCNCMLLPLLLTLLAGVLPAAGVAMARNMLVSPAMGLSTYAAGKMAICQGATKWYLTQVRAGAVTICIHS